MNVGGLRLEVEVGVWALEVGNWRLEVEVGDWRLGVGGWRLDVICQRLKVEGIPLLI